MVFKTKKHKEEIVEEVEEVESPTAEEIVSEDEITKETTSEEPVKTEDLDNQLNAVLNELNNRIQNLEATLYRLKNI